MAGSRCQGVNVEEIALALSTLAINKQVRERTRLMEVVIEESSQRGLIAVIDYWDISLQDPNGTRIF